MNLLRALFRRPAPVAQAVPAGPERTPVTPCPEGFKWMGQPFTHCEGCERPAWEHDGWADNAEDNPFSGKLKLRPWKPGERERIEARWKPRGDG